MTNIKVRIGDQNAIKSKIGPQSAIKIISSTSSGGVTDATNAINVIGGVADVTKLNVSGVSTFVGLSTFVGDVYIGGDLYIKDDLVFDEVNLRNANISGILTVNQSIYYTIGQPYGVAYFDSNDQLVSTGTTSSAISETNYILSTNSSGVPSWSNAIDGGSY